MDGVPPIIGVKYAIGCAISVLFCALLYLNVAVSAPTPWSAPHEVFSWTDERLLEAQIPGGRFLSRSTYLRCEKDGRFVMYHADGRTSWVGTECWGWRRWIGREVSP